MKSNIPETSYEINGKVHGGHFEADMAGVARAIEDHVVKNPAFVHKIDTLYRQTIEEDTTF